MNLLKTPRRRITAVAAAAFLGLIGAAAAISPASAHHPGLSGIAKCVDGGTGAWTVDWTLVPIAASSIGKITKVDSSSGSTLEKIAVGEFLRKDGSITDTQTFTKADTTTTLTVEVNWPLAKTTKEITATAAPTTDCSPSPQPSASVSVPPSVEPSAEPSDEPSTPTSDEPSVEPSASASTPVLPGEPNAFLDRDCTSMTIGLDNPADGESITLYFKTSKGESRELTVKPGQVESAKFSATPGFTVTVTAEGLDGGSQTIAYELPEDCAVAGSGGGNQLPLTGAAAGSIAGGAALLLAIGGFLFVMARRRKVKFTA